MKQLTALLALSSTLLLAACANPPMSGGRAAKASQAIEHAAHLSAGKAPSAVPSHMHGSMHDHMKSMQPMREKMMAAKTPAERQHMLEMRMDMMEAMMQRMHGSAAAPATQ